MLTKLINWLNGPPPEAAPSPSDIIAACEAIESLFGEKT